MKTDRFYYVENGFSHKLEIMYGFCPELDDPESRYIFKVKCLLFKKVKGKWEELSFGLLKGSVKTHASHLSKVFRWHLRYKNGLPLYYVENALHYYDLFHQTGIDTILISLMYHIGYLYLPEDEDFDLHQKVEKATLIKWLQERAPKLKKLMEFELQDIYNV